MELGWWHAHTVKCVSFLNGGLSPLLDSLELSEPGAGVRFASAKSQADTKQAQATPDPKVLFLLNSVLLFTPPTTPKLPRETWTELGNGERDRALR